MNREFSGRYGTATHAHATAASLSFALPAAGPDLQVPCPRGKRAEPHDKWGPQLLD